MRSFIAEIVDVYIKNYATQALRTCIVTPNRRAHRFIKKDIIQQNDDNGFLPSFFSIDEFILNHIPMQRIEETDLTFILYEVFIHQKDYENLDFDEFLSYSSILLHDFNEIDMQMADGEAIFSYLTDTKAIQLWNPDGSPLSDSQKEYLRFYNLLAFVYHDFKSTLLEKNLCYQGMGYRYFAENIDDCLDKVSFENMIFAGFNALTKSEEKIIKTIKQRKQAILLWDVDSYYFKKEIMEAGMYMRKYKIWDSDIENQVQNHYQNNKNIEFIGTAGILGQARIAAQIIEEQTHKNNDKAQEKSEFENNTALIPADESLLIPLLNSLSPSILKNINVTMGYPLQHSNAYRLADSFIKLHLHATRTSKQGTNKQSLYQNDLWEILNNDLIKNINPHQNKTSSPSAQSYIRESEVFSILIKWELSAIKTIFETCHNNPQHLLDKIHFLFLFILKKNKETEALNISDAESDAIMQLLAIISRLKKLQEKHQKPNTIQGFHILYRQLTKGLSQAFSGKIEEGIQLMGLLETRLMDFENIILLSVNEDILPASSFTNSFIPADIKYEFQLPGIQEKTAVYAYHFYRLLQRAKNVYLIYSTTKKKLSGGEKSRFIKQLEFELKKYNKHINIQNKLLTLDNIKIQNAPELSIKKDDKIQQRLQEIAIKGLSPTRIISYIRCPLQFYFQTVAKIKEPEQAQDIIDDRILGDAIHHILEDFFKPYIGKTFPFEKLNGFLKQIPELVHHYYKKSFKGKIDEGANFLSLKDTEYYLIQFIKQEIQAAKHDNSTIEIIGLEENLKRKISLNNGSKVLIHGNADRIDRKNQIIRILDYKTGKVDPKKVKIPKKTDSNILNPIFEDIEYDKATQLFIYRWMYQAYNTSPIQSGIVSFRQITNPYIMLQTKDKDEELQKDFTTLIEEIFDANINFTTTDNEKSCGYCTYKNICLKQ